MSARAALSRGRPTGTAALAQAWAESGALLERAPDLVALFCAAEHAEAAHDLADALSELAPHAAIIGACAADGVIGAGTEHQGAPRLALLAATLPAGARVTPFHAKLGEGHDGPRARGPARAAGGCDRARDGRSPLDAGRGTRRRSRRRAAARWIRRASAASARRGCSRTAAVSRRAPSASCSTACPCGPIVSQGARPIGPEMVVTAADGNFVLELAGRAGAGARCRQVVAELSPSERALLENGLLMGLVIDENRPEYGLGDFLVRVVLGADSNSGAVAIGDVPRVGQTVRLHVRDAESASHELNELLARAGGSPHPPRSSFRATGADATCSRRPTMTREPSHDCSKRCRCRLLLPG